MLDEGTGAYIGDFYKAVDIESKDEDHYSYRARLGTTANTSVQLFHQFSFLLPEPKLQLPSTVTLIGILHRDDLLLLGWWRPRADWRFSLHTCSRL